MTDTPAPAAPPAALSLAERARAAAAHRASADDPAWSDPRWITGAHRAAARLAITLGVPADRILIEASTVRRYGGWPWPELTVTDSGATFRFVALYGESDQLTALTACPYCENEVPTFPIRTLADLGDTLRGENDDDPVDAYHHDPAHHPECYHAAPTPAA